MCRLPVLRATERNNIFWIVIVETLFIRNIMHNINVKINKKNFS